MIVKTSFSPIKKIEFAKFSDQNEEMGRAYLIIHTRPNGKKAALIEDVFTEEKFRKQGVASELMLELIKTAREANCYKICLGCSNENIHLYQRFGFEVYENQMRLSL